MPVITVGGEIGFDCVPFNPRWVSKKGQFAVGFVIIFLTNLELLKSHLPLLLVLKVCAMVSQNAYLRLSLVS